MRNRVKRIPDEIALKAATEFVTTSISIKDLQRKYNFTGVGTLYKWIRKFGLSQPSDTELKVNDIMKKERSKTSHEQELEKKIEQLEKSINEYKALMPHVVAAKKLIEAGYKVGKGDMIGYVIVKGGSKIALRAQPYTLVKDIREIDVDYYIEHQVIPAALRILEVFGVKPDQIISGKMGKSILDFM